MYSKIRALQLVALIAVIGICFSNCAKSGSGNGNSTTTQAATPVSLTIALSSGKPVAKAYYYHNVLELIATATNSDGSQTNVTDQVTWSASPTDDIAGAVMVPNITTGSTVPVEAMQVGPITDANENCTITATLPNGVTASVTTHLSGTGGGSGVTYDLFGN